VRIGQDIEVIVMGVKGNQVRIGIKAPKDVRVDREEIRVKIDAEKRRGRHE
jgi:carbon storage regulator